MRLVSTADKCDQFSVVTSCRAAGPESRHPTRPSVVITKPRQAGPSPVNSVTESATVVFRQRGRDHLISVDRHVAP